MWLTLSRQLLSRNKSPISTLPATCVLPVCQLVIWWLSLLVSSAWCRVTLLFLVRTKKREREGSTLVAFWRLVDFCQVLPAKRVSDDVRKGRVVVYMVNFP